MAVGLVILGALALLIFFGVTDKLFERVGISNWIAFLIALVLAGSVLIPDITFGTPTNFAISVSGFVLPVAIVTVLLIVAAASRRLMLSVYGIICVAAAVTVVRLTVPPTTDVLAISGGIVTGIVAGILAHAVGRSTLATVTGAVGGIILGDIAAGLVHSLYSGGSFVRLGSFGIFDAIVIGAVFSLIFAEVVNAIRRSAQGHKRGRGRQLNTEASVDVKKEPPPPKKNCDNAGCIKEYFEE